MTHFFLFVEDGPFNSLCFDIIRFHWIIFSIVDQTPIRKIQGSPPSLPPMLVHWQVPFGMIHIFRIVVYCILLIVLNRSCRTYIHIFKMFLYIMLFDWYYFFVWYIYFYMICSRFSLIIRRHQLYHLSEN